MSTKRVSIARVCVYVSDYGIKITISSFIKFDLGPYPGGVTTSFILSDIYEAIKEEQSVPIEFNHQFNLPYAPQLFPSLR